MLLLLNVKGLFGSYLDRWPHRAGDSYMPVPDRFVISNFHFTARGQVPSMEMYCARWSNEEATIHADIMANHRDVPSCLDICWVHFFLFSFGNCWLQSCRMEACLHLDTMKCFSLMKGVCVCVNVRHIKNIHIKLDININIWKDSLLRLFKLQSIRIRSPHTQEASQPPAQFNHVQPHYPLEWADGLVAPIDIILKSRQNEFKSSLATGWF